ncbi:MULTISPECIES: hypothetical protein [Bacillus cereus group]|uniref:hypothetical protein n=1 Tax=Bacillus cereus group TaxID=86661 RepID=UPI001F1E57B7|nr:hypothetical protein [Bacillus cereus]MDA1521461.1 hypothetical protein [Bacillus cereus]BCC09533.1 hypothetical protein BCM0060_p2199 [Bacillus cereus]BCC16522.1 hypothetical protein BCM0075_1292 [Bacillus cereus]BCC50571.1 hypothetical protein BCJMU02_p2165 [Bacillus cereus]BCD08966.1 hypothetical protein BC30052_p2248 [Bacillus cereus]
MKQLFLHQWSEMDQFNHTYPYLEDVLESLQVKETDEITFHLFVQEDTHVKIERLQERLALLCKSVVDVQVSVLSGLTNIKKLQEYVNAYIETEIEAYEQVYIHLGQGNAGLQHMLAHTLWQQHPNKLNMFTGNGLQKDNYYKITDADEYASENEMYHYIYDFMKHGNYRAAKEIVKKHMPDQRAEELLNFAQALTQLQFHSQNGEDSFELLHRVLREIGSNQEELQFVLEMKKLKQREQKAFLSFLYDFAHMHYEEDRLIDFIVLYYRLVEELLLYGIGWDVNRDQFMIRKDASHTLRIPHWRITRHLHSYIKVLKDEIRQIENRHRIKIRRDKNVATFSRFMERERYFLQLYYFFYDKKLEELLHFRHEGVSGHGFEDFTKDQFEALCDGESPLAHITPMMERLKVKPEFSLFELVEKAVLGLVNKKVDEKEKTPL